MGQCSIKDGDELEISSSTSTHTTSNGTPYEVVVNPWIETIFWQCFELHNCPQYWWKALQQGCWNKHWRPKMCLNE